VTDLPLRDAISTPQTKRRYTRRVFATIAGRYDLVTVLLSFNCDRAWKRRMIARAHVRPGELALDLACGTGDLTFPLARDGARVVGLDITAHMIELAQRKAGERRTARAWSGVAGGLRTPDLGSRTTRDALFLVGDMMALPFPDSTFGLVTTGYGIRNVPDIAGALREVHRVLEPGGRFFSLDFDRPDHPVIRAAYLAYLTVVGSALGWVLHRDPDTYRYIPETIRTYPGAAGVVSLLKSAGFEAASYEPVFGGFMAMHRAVKGGLAPPKPGPERQGEGG
jgi:demethylmenaquinone methyltransferase/2-methoxy-6-polyprenyl-1,4-benzoquinol methylase